MTRKGHGEYPAGWKEFAAELKEQAGWKCVRCQHPHDPASGYTLTVHHLTMNKAEPFTHWWAFAALCQRCHLSIQAKVHMDRPWLFEHTDWFKPYAAGFFAHKYLGLELSRDEVMARLDYYASLEARLLRAA